QDQRPLAHRRHAEHRRPPRPAALTTKAELTTYRDIGRTTGVEPFGRPERPTCKMSVLWLLIACLCAYGAYRAFRGGFTDPQSERLNNYRFLGYAVALLFTPSITC